MKKYIIAIVVLSSCAKRGDTLKHEFGVIVTKGYVPSSSGVAVGTGYSTSGDLSTTTHYYSTEESFTTVMKCEHGAVFTITSKELFSKVNAGDSVVIDYYDMIKKGRVVDFDFVDANKRIANSIQ